MSARYLRLAAPAAAALLTLVLAGGAHATSPLAIISDNGLGAVRWTNSVALNTDTSQICGFSNTGVELCGAETVASTLVSQHDGSSVRVFNFSSLTLDRGIGLVLQGSRPAAIVASGDIVINGTVIIDSGIHAGGDDSASAPGATGGKVGFGNGKHVDCCYYNTSSGGGGGGKASAGENGNPGHLAFGGDNGFGGLGGAPDAVASILSGGGGGGGGQTACNYYTCGLAGGSGGHGGGAALFETPGNITIGAFGYIEANGANGREANSGPAAAGGGGGGGAIWFDAGEAWTNYGMITALGGQGASGRTDDPHFGYYGDGGNGSGGDIFIDPQSISNFGLIDVADGAGGSAFGGHVTFVAPSVIQQGSVVGVAPGVPEPASWALMMMGIGGLGATLRSAARRMAPIAAQAAEI